ncbi:MAG: heavy-metal-associated domain-containing protein [Ardenticatenaceae bacterium]|nr:heavy-metal-associated domain-containing protein [Ardenticatenaceae bacterium]MCB9003435.1 heavy-metal-associated domain-containing protein [Ardenticatenaceae bacterium]
MEILTLDVPSMYGDHHVTAVRALLLQVAGVSDVYASSSFHLVEVQYDPATLSPEVIKNKLEEAGYLDELPTPAETSTPATEKSDGEPAFFRHTAAYAQTGRTVSFAQTLPNVGRPLWPCPGMGPVKVIPKEEEVIHG